MLDLLFEESIINSTLLWCEESTRLPDEVNNIEKAFALEMLHINPFYPIYYIVNIYPENQMFMIESCIKYINNSCEILLCGECLLLSNL